MSRVDAARFGAMKAALPLAGSVAASDAFFPFPDGLEAVADAGATAVIQPGGSVRDAEVIDAANRLGIAMAFTGFATSATADTVPKLDLTRMGQPVLRAPHDIISAKPSLGVGYRCIQAAGVSV